MGHVKYLLALDQGTTSSRAILFDETGRACGTAQCEFRQQFPKDGWVEHDAEEIWLTQWDVVKQVLSESGLSAGDIAGIGITNQRETTVVWDRQSAKPICNAIVWQDRRTADYTAALKAEGLEPEVRSTTGLVLDPYFSGTKLRWILENIPDARRRAEAEELAFGTIDTWLLWKLSGGALHMTDVSNASRTLLMNLACCEWDVGMLKRFEIPESVLPEIRSSSEVYGECVLPELKGVPIAGIAGDQHAALFGQCCFEKGSAKNTYGTGSFMLMNTGYEPAPAETLLSTVAWKVGEKVEYALEGSVFITGELIQWLRDGLKIINSAPEVENLAATVEDSGGICVVPAFAGLGAPHWDPYARGTIMGITRGTTDGHVARAALEAIVFQCADLLGAMKNEGGLGLSELKVDGGASMNNLMLQLQSDVLDVPVIRPAQTETTALGAAYLAGLAVGVFKDKAEIAARWELSRKFEPGGNKALRVRYESDWSRAVERSKDWARK